MRTGQWRVRCGKGSLLGHFYVYGPNVFKHFTDWHEAQAFAMQQSRTVAVKLPQAETVAEISGEAPPALVKVISWKTVTSIQEGHNEVDIFTADLKPLGEYLLSLHYHHERNQK